MQTMLSQSSQRTQRARHTNCLPVVKTIAAATVCSLGFLMTAFGSQDARAQAASNPSGSASGERYYTHIAKAGDTFGSLAQRYLADTKNWMLLQRANSIANPKRIPVGTNVRIPVSAMRTEIAAATVVSTSGSVSANGKTATVGQKLNESDKLDTGENGFVTIKLADGSTITVQSKSAVQLERTRQLANTGGVGDTVVRVNNGRIETNVSKQNAAARYEVKTPMATMGVRGTIFRVGTDPATNRGQSEVVEGAVGVTGASAGANAPASTALNLSQGFGTVVETGKAPLPPVKLLPAPRFNGLPAESAQTAVNVVLVPVEGATRYRAQAALDRGFTQLVADEATTAPNITLTNLPDGKLFVRARAVDGLGLEGLDSTNEITIAARPVPPKLTLPANAQGVSSGSVNFQWQSSTEASAYRVQVSRDAAFANTAVDASGVRVTNFTAESPLQVGAWFWRVASVDAKGKVGPFGETSRFTIQAAPLLVTPEVSAGEARFRWQADSGQRFQVQLSRRESFRELIVDRVVDKPEVLVDKLPKNVYFFRVRPVDENGNGVGAWSETQSIEVFNWPL
jgi:hypothetical protein